MWILDGEGCHSGVSPASPEQHHHSPFEATDIGRVGILKDSFSAGNKNKAYGSIRLWQATWGKGRAVPDAGNVEMLGIYLSSGRGCPGPCPLHLRR